SLDDADALVQEALKGMEGLSGEGLAFPDEPSFVPLDEGEGELPAGFDTEPSPLDDSELGATAVMSLSSDEMDEINRFISQTESLPLAGGDDFESYTSGEVMAAIDAAAGGALDFDAAAAGFDDELVDATVAMPGLAAE